MFTGIVTDIETIISMERRGDLRVRMSMSWDPDSVDIGSSVCCDGACLTVVDRGMDSDTGGAWFEVDVSAETSARTRVESGSAPWIVGSRVNLERPLRVGEELGGHILSGHVDGVAVVIGIESSGASRRVQLKAPGGLMRYIATKGSIALNGTSLTVNSVEDDRFDVNLIPHTLAATTWGAVEEGDAVNLEVDLLARYVARLFETGDGHVQG
ncbi:MAG: riboflavin synthase [Paracoccaceae bacterium]|nr:riboflavin synthase [Paracoccaceae bacterium]MDE2911306.1 riboflavin synthase [Paracoccaceae bacterium]